MDLYLKVRHFLNMYERLDEHYVIYTQFLENHSFMIKLFCVDPALNLQECLDKGRSTVFFPLRFYRSNIIRSYSVQKEENYAIYAKTAFSKEQSCLLIGDGVSSKYTRRNRMEFQNIARYIQKIVSAKKKEIIWCFFRRTVF